MRNLEDMSLNEIESFGKDIQSGISSDVTRLVNGVRSIELGETGKQITDMVVQAQNVSKGLQPRGIGKMITSSKKWLKRYDTVESTIQGLDDSVNKEIKRLNSILNGCYENGVMLNKRLEELQQSEQDLGEIIDSYTGNDTYKLSTAVHRHKTLVSTIALVKQEIGKSMIVITQNKEITSQLSEARDNVIPYIKIMLINTLASKANTEALALKRVMKRAVNNMITQTADEISANADELIKGREDTLLDFSSIEKANQTLIKTYQKLQDSINDGIGQDKQLVDSLKSSIEYLDSISIGKEMNVQ